MNDVDITEIIKVRLIELLDHFSIDTGRMTVIQAVQTSAAAIADDVRFLYVPSETTSAAGKTMQQVQDDTKPSDS